MLNRVRHPSNATHLLLCAARPALSDDAFLEKTVRLVHEGLDFLWAGLDELDAPYFHSQANFFLIDVQGPADRFYEAMLRRGVIVRSMSAYGYPNYIRINVGLPEENRRFLAAFAEVRGDAP